MSIKRILLSAILVLAVVSIVFVEAAPSPFFDAIYDALNGNGRRTYGYGGYENGYNYNYGYGYNGYNGNRGYNGYRNAEKPRQGKTYKEICRVHFPDSVAVPGSGGIVCPY